jgi:beta-glucuronidase
LASTAVEVSLEAGVVTVSAEIKLDRASLWSPESPALHVAKLSLGGDDLIERFGIREVSVDGSEILVNGCAVRLLGFCRHEAHPQFGCGVPAAVQIEDIQLLEEMGCNFVRGSHYPQDPRFLDLCDERGILVWDEAIGRQHRAEHFADPAFIDAQLVNIREMIAAGTNHPSVIIWGLQNESRSDEPVNRGGYERLIGEIRSLDPSRPVTYASNRWPNNLIDIISINTYPGWYHGAIDEIPKLLDSIINAIDSSTSKGKPVIVSEIGAGSVPGWHDRNHSRWSEEYQAELLEMVIRYLFSERERYCGLAIWQFCDCRTAEQTARTMGRPRGFNNKGVIDEHRTPKLGFDAVKRGFAGL